jgi:hypothetical protein
MHCGVCDTINPNAFLKHDPEPVRPWAQAGDIDCLNCGSVLRKNASGPPSWWVRRIVNGEPVIAPRLHLESLRRLAALLRDSGSKAPWTHAIEIMARAEAGSHAFLPSASTRGLAWLSSVFGMKID